MIKTTNAVQVDNLLFVSGFYQCLLTLEWIINLSWYLRCPFYVLVRWIYIVEEELCSIFPYVRLVELKQWFVVLFLGNLIPYISHVLCKFDPHAIIWKFMNSTPIPRWNNDGDKK